MANFVFATIFIAAAAISSAKALSCYNCLYAEGSPAGYGSVEDCRQNPPSQYLQPWGPMFLKSSKPLRNFVPHVTEAFLKAPSIRLTPRPVCITLFFKGTIPAEPEIDLGALNGQLLQRISEGETSVANGCYPLNTSEFPFPPGTQVQSLAACVCDTDGCNGIDAPY